MSPLRRCGHRDSTPCCSDCCVLQMFVTMALARLQQPLPECSHQLEVEETMQAVLDTVFSVHVDHVDREAQHREVHDKRQETTGGHGAVVDCAPRTHGSVLFSEVA